MAKLGTTKCFYKDPISEDAIRLSTMAKEAPLFGRLEHKHLRGDAKRSTKSDRRDYWRGVVNKVETAAIACQFGSLFRVIRSTSGKRSSIQPLLCNSSSMLTLDVGDILTRWVEHFSQLRNLPLGRPVAIVPALVPF